jgi:hypothetical protein
MIGRSVEKPSSVVSALTVLANAPIIGSAVFAARRSTRSPVLVVASGRA